MSKPSAVALPDTPEPSDEVIGRVHLLLAGDWTPYLKSGTEVIPYANTASGLGNPIATINEWDWGLLRHDIHVLYHRAGSSRGEE